MSIRKKNNPLITVYITNYNYERYIGKSISSVLEQSYQNFELIIIDDGSTDNSGKIINSFNDPRIVLKIFNKNIGLNKSNNIAIKKSKGKYIIRLDADDYFEKNALKIFINHIAKNKETSLIYPDYYIIDENGMKLSRVKRENFINKVRMLDLPAHGACTMFKTSTLKKIGGYDESFNCQDGYDIWLKIINKYHISNINYPLFSYRQHTTNLTKNEYKILSTRAKIKEKRVKKLKLNKKDTLAIITIRDASFNKIINPFTKINKKTLIDTAISYATKSKYISQILVSTDSEKIQDYIRKKKNISLETKDFKDKNNLDLSIYNILKNKKYKKFKNVLIIFIEFPFRSEVYLDKAINSLRLFNADVIECVRKENRLIYYHDGKGLKLLKSNKFLKAERDSIYVRTGGVVAINVSKFKKNKKIYSKSKIGHILIDERSSFSIKSLLDLKIAKKMHNNFLNKKYL